MVTSQTIVELTLFFGIAVILIGVCVLLNTIKIRDKKIHYILFGLIAILAILVTILLIINSIIWFNDDSLHLGLILGLPALILITAGMVLVLYDERRFVFWHGLLGMSSWILTLLNVISLFWLDNDTANEYSGVLHFVHIIGGGGGLAVGFANMLFGISGQRKPAKLTGYITIGCWWGAFLLGLFF